MSVLTTDGVLLDAGESLKLLLQTHFPDGRLGSTIAPGSPGVTDFTGICQYITVKKVHAAFKSFGDFKSAGPDGLPPRALKCLDGRHLEVISLLYKLSIATGCVPVTWRTMKVVFLPKAGKTDYTIAKAYRPITLSNFILKGIERLIQWYISEFIIKKPLFRQHAYTKGRSCETALSVFINDVEHAIYNKEYVLAVSLDCSGAFDSIRFDSAERGMRRKGIPDNIIRWYCNLLRGRLVTASVQGKIECVVPARGSPQGGVLSPLIWNIIIDELLSSFKNRAVKVIGYADDVLLYVVGKDVTTLGRLIQEALDEVTGWGDENGLTFNPLKTQAVIFTLGWRSPSPPLVEMDGVALEYSNTMTYLGICIHRNLRWHRHVKQRVDKGRALLMKCKNVINQKWGLTPKKMEWIYKAIVRPKITYGAVVWAASLREGTMNLLNKVQRLALLSITQPLRSTPTAGLENLMGWLPLGLHAQEIGLSSYIRIKETVSNFWDGQGHHGQRGHLSVWRKLSRLAIPEGYQLTRGYTLVYGITLGIMQQKKQI